MSGQFEAYLPGWFKTICCASLTSRVVGVVMVDFKRKKQKLRFLVDKVRFLCLFVARWRVCKKRFLDRTRRRRKL